MRAQAPWKLAFAAAALLSLGVGAGFWMAPAPHQPGHFAALNTQALAARGRSRLLWRATPRSDTALVAAAEHCTLAVDTMDNDGSEGRPAREIRVHIECSGGLAYHTLDFAYGERRVGGCAITNGGDASLFCSIEGRTSGEAVRLFVDTRHGTLRLRKDGVSAAFDLDLVESVSFPEGGPSRAQTRGHSTLRTTGTITHVSGIPSDGALPRPRVRAGAECNVQVTSQDGAHESQCDMLVTCAGTRFEARGVCTLDEHGQIERVVDMVPSDGAGGRGDDNASVIFDVHERRLVLMESDGHEAFVVGVTVDSSRSRARYL